MNKTIEALKLAEEAILPATLGALITAKKANKALAAIREALAEPVKPSQLADASLEPVASPIMTKQEVKELSKKMWDELQDAAFAENTPKYWTYMVNNTWRNIDEQQPPEDAYDEGTLEPLYAAPVDAKAIQAEADIELQREIVRLQAIIDEQRSGAESIKKNLDWVRAEALEEAAKVAAGYDAMPWKHCQTSAHAADMVSSSIAAAIRGLK